MSKHRICFSTGRVNLTEDDDEEPAPLALTEEDHSAAQLTALDDGSAVLD